MYSFPNLKVLDLNLCEFGKTKSITYKAEGFIRILLSIVTTIFQYFSHQYDYILGVFLSIYVCKLTCKYKTKFDLTVHTEG